MRSTFAGITAILVFGLLQWFAKTFFAGTLLEGGTGRDIISTVVLGSTLVTFFAAWAYYPRLRRRTYHRTRPPRSPYQRREKDRTRPARWHSSKQRKR